MATTLNAITGASGTLGSHIAEQLVARGDRVRALIRPTSDTRFLRELGVELLEGDATDRASVEQLVSGADVVYHCAAKTGNWGAWSEYRRENVEATQNVVRACSAHGEVRRMLHVSSIAAYGHPRAQDRPLGEDAPLGQRLWLWDHYNRSKIEAEWCVRTLRSRGTIIRPTLFYGPRDKAFLPRIMRALCQEGVWLIGSGENLLNVIYVADVAELAIAAAGREEAAGQAYNACTEGDLTQRELIHSLCKAMQLPPVHRRIPKRFAYCAGFAAELIGRVLRKKQSPKITRHAISAFVRPVHFSNSKARLTLGWRPRVNTREGLARTLAWLKTEMPELFGATVAAPPAVHRSRVEDEDLQHSCH